MMSSSCSSVTVTSMLSLTMSESSDMSCNIKLVLLGELVALLLKLFFGKMEES